MITMTIFAYKTLFLTDKDDDKAEQGRRSRGGGQGGSCPSFGEKNDKQPYGDVHICLGYFH